jgi:hypothetical protein
MGGATCRVRVTTGAKPSCFYRLPKLQKIRWFLTAAAYWRRNIKASLRCSEMTNPRHPRPWNAVVLKRTHENNRSDFVHVLPAFVSKCMEGGKRGRSADMAHKYASLPPIGMHGCDLPPQNLQAPSPSKIKDWQYAEPVVSPRDQWSAGTTHARVGPLMTAYWEGLGAELRI